MYWLRVFTGDGCVSAADDEWRFQFAQLWSLQPGDLQQQSSWRSSGRPRSPSDRPTIPKSGTNCQLY